MLDKLYGKINTISPDGLTYLFKKEIKNVPQITMFQLVERSFVKKFFDKMDLNFILFSVLDEASKLKEFQQMVNQTKWVKNLSEGSE